MVPCDNLWKHLQHLGVPLHLQQVVEVMYTVVYAKVQINGDTYGEVMSNFSVKEWCPLSPTLFNSYIDEFGTYLNKIDRDSTCLFYTVVAILPHANEVVFLSKSWSILQRLLNKLF